MSRFYSMDDGDNDEVQDNAQRSDLARTNPRSLAGPSRLGALSDDNPFLSSLQRRDGDDGDGDGDDDARGATPRRGKSQSQTPAFLRQPDTSTSLPRGMRMGTAIDLDLDASSTTSSDDADPLRRSRRTLATRPTSAIEALQMAWRSERGAPDILKWNQRAVDDLCANIEEQVKILESLSTDASTTEEEHLRLGLVQLDVERARWLLRSYIRCRIEKIERFSAYLTSDVQARSRLSGTERDYVARFQALRATHFRDSVLDYLPENMRGLEDRGQGEAGSAGDMVTRPDLDKPVFVRALEDCGEIRLPNDEPVPIEAGSIHMLRYSAVRYLLERGSMEML